MDTMNDTNNSPRYPVNGPLCIVHVDSDTSANSPASQLTNKLVINRVVNGFWVYMKTNRKDTLDESLKLENYVFLEIFN